MDMPVRMRVSMAVRMAVTVPVRVSMAVRMAVTVPVRVSVIVRMLMISHRTCLQYMNNYSYVL